MTQGAGVKEEQEPHDDKSQTSMQLPAEIDQISAESGIIVSNHQVQSIDIAEKFTRTKTSQGWYITLHRPCRVTINLTTSMRKIEISLIEGDIIEKDESDLIILRKQTADAYKSKKSGASLARSRDELLQTSTTSV